MTPPIKDNLQGTIEEQLAEFQEPIQSPVLPEVAAPAAPSAAPDVAATSAAAPTTANAKPPVATEPVPTDLEKHEAAEAAKTPEQRQAERDAFVDSVYASINDATEKSNAPPEKTTSGQASDRTAETINFNMTVSQYFAISNAIDKIKGLTTKRKLSLKQSLMRMRRGEGAEGDFYTLQGIRSESSYTKTLTRGEKAYQVSRNLGGDQATEAFSQLIDQPMTDAAASVMGGVARGDFRTSEELYDFIGSKTDLPPQLIVGQAQQDELQRFFAETGKPSFTEEDPNYPMLSTQLRINRTEKDKMQREGQMAIQENLTEELEEREAIKTGEYIKRTNGAYESKNNLPPGHATFFKQWLLGRGFTADPALSTMYMDDVDAGRVAGAPLGDGISTGANSDPASRFDNKGFGVSYNKNKMDKVVNDTLNEMDEDAMYEDARYEVYGAAAKVTNGHGGEELMSALDEKIDARFDEIDTQRDAKLIGLVNNQVFGKTIDGALKNPKTINVTSTDGYGADIFISREEFVDNVAGAENWPKELRDSVLDEDASSIPSVQAFKQKVINAYKAAKYAASKEIAKSLNETAAGAKRYFPNSKAYNAQTGYSVPMGDVGAVIKSKETGNYCAVTNIPDDRFGAKLRSLNVESLPEVLRARIEKTNRNPDNYTNVKIDLGGKMIDSRVYDGAKYTRAIFGDSNYSGIIKRGFVDDSTLKLFSKDSRHLAYQIGDRVLYAGENPETALKLMIRQDAMTDEGAWGDINAGLNDILDKSRRKETEGDTTGMVETFDNVKKDLIKRLCRPFGGGTWTKEEVERDLDSIKFADKDGQAAIDLLESGTVDGIRAGYSMILTSFYDRAVEYDVSKARKLYPKMEKTVKSMIETGSNEYERLGQLDLYQRKLSSMEQLEVSITTLPTVEEAIDKARSIRIAAGTQATKLGKLRSNIKRAGLQKSSVLEKYYKYYANMEDHMEGMESSIISNQGRGFYNPIDLEHRLTLAR